MTLSETYYDSLWRYENHFKDDAAKETLIQDSKNYINHLESKLVEYELEIEELK